jgi:hypothetical protein
MILIPFTMHFISIKSILSDHLSYVTIFHSSIGRSDKIDLTIKNRVTRTPLINSVAPEGYAVPAPLVAPVGTAYEIL